MRSPPGPYVTIAAAQEYVRDRGRGGLPLIASSTWSANGTLHVLYASPAMLNDYLGGYYFFFVDGYPVGQLYFEMDREASPVDDTTFMVTYDAFAASDAHCCSSRGRSSARVHWSGSQLVALDPITDAYQSLGPVDDYPFRSSSPTPAEAPST